MSGYGDVPDEMTPDEIDDAIAERLLRGQVPGDRSDLQGLSLLLSEVRDLAAEPSTPSASLAALLRDGFVAAPAAAAVAARPSLRRRLAAVAGLSLAGKVLAGTGVAMAAVTTAAGAGVLPQAVEDGVGSVVRVLTPFDVAPEPGQPGLRPVPVPSATRTTTPVLPAEASQVPSPAPRPEQVATQRPAGPPAGVPAQATQRPTQAPVPTPAQERRPTATPGPQERPSGGARPTTRPTAAPAMTPQARPSERGGPGGRPDQGAAERGSAAGPRG